MNEGELRDMMYTAQLPDNDLPYSIRYPRGQGVMPQWRTSMKKLATGKGRTIQEGSEVAILSFGHPGNFVVNACKMLAEDGIVPGHYDMRFAKPLDEDLLHKVCRKYPRIITVEDGTVMGGFGSAVLEFLAMHQYQNLVEIMGIPDRIVEHGKPEELYRECGFDAQGIASKVRNCTDPENQDKAAALLASLKPDMGMN